VSGHKRHAAGTQVQVPCQGPAAIRGGRGETTWLGAALDRCLAVARLGRCRGTPEAWFL